MPQPSLFEDWPDDAESIDSGVSREKATGAYYTPEELVRSLVGWVIRRPADRMLDPSCGDGRFLAAHSNSVGVEQDSRACDIVHKRAPGSLIHQGDFFAWASRTHERFDCAAGNPPFIRYQRFTGAVREAAIRLCKRHGAYFSGLSSSWAPFLVATASLLKLGGRMAFVVPAEIGHAPYASPLLEFLARNFEHVHVIAVRKKLFAGLSEDCWLLYADGFGGTTNEFRLTPLEQFAFRSAPPQGGSAVRVSDWRGWNSRLRPFLLPKPTRDIYTAAISNRATKRLGDVASVGIGYVTGANDFFHLRPSVAKRLDIPRCLLHAAVRNGKSLSDGCIDAARVQSWLDADEPILLLRLSRTTDIPPTVQRYLDSQAGREARTTYKCDLPHEKWTRS
jgi:adenine-specific DNA methylase